MITDEARLTLGLLLLSAVGELRSRMAWRKRLSLRKLPLRNSYGLAYRDGTALPKGQP